MKTPALILAALAAGALLYATAAPAGQQAPPSRGEFNALKKRTAAVETRARNVEAFLGACFGRGVAIGRFEGYVYQFDNGTVDVTTALDVIDGNETPHAYLLDIGAECARAIDTMGIELKRVQLR